MTLLSPPAQRFLLKPLPHFAGLCALLTGFVWMCTRATPALLLVSVSIAADVVVNFFFFITLISSLELSDTKVYEP